MYHVIKCSHRKPQTWTDTLPQPKQWKRNMKFGTYPTKDSLRVVDTLAKAKVQGLLHHTIPHDTIRAKVAGKIFRRLSWFPNGSS